MQVDSDTVKAVLNPSLDTETGQDALQIKLVDYLAEFGRPAHLGSHVGQYVNRELKINTSVSSRPFYSCCAFLQTWKGNNHVLPLHTGPASDVSPIKA